MPIVVLPHPIGGSTMDTIAPKLDAAMDEIVSKLTTPLPVIADSNAAAPNVQAEHIRSTTDDEWGELQSQLRDHGWGDGLPLVPPTEARVQAMYKYVDHAPDHVVARLAPKMGAATVELIAVNAVMAGCRPQHMPLLIAAIGALADKRFNLYGIQVTTHCVSPLLIVSGPLAAAMNIHHSSGMFGPGPWDNGVVGRAIRLLLLNVGGATPAKVDKSTMGHPAKYTFCMAEDETSIAWPSLRAERGYSGDTSTVTVIGAEGPHNINDHESTTADGIIMMIAGTMAQPGQNNVYYAAEPLMIVSPEHAATIAAGGYTKDGLKQALYERARIPLSKFSRENIERRMYRKFPQRYKDQGLDVEVTVAQSWQDIMICVAGGPGKHSMYVPTFGGTRSVTVPITHADGRPYLPGDIGYSGQATPA